MSSECTVCEAMILVEMWAYLATIITPRHVTLLALLEQSKNPFPDYHRLSGLTVLQKESVCVQLKHNSYFQSNFSVTVLYHSLW